MANVNLFSLTGLNIGSSFSLGTVKRNNNYTLTQQNPSIFSEKPADSTPPVTTPNTTTNVTADTNKQDSISQGAEAEVDKYIADHPGTTREAAYKALFMDYTLPKVDRSIPQTRKDLIALVDQYMEKHPDANRKKVELELVTYLWSKALQKN